MDEYDPFGGMGEAIPQLPPSRPFCDLAVVREFGALHRWYCESLGWNGQELWLKLIVKVPPERPEPFVVDGRVPQTTPGLRVTYALGGKTGTLSHCQPVEVDRVIELTLTAQELADGPPAAN